MKDSLSVLKSLPPIATLVTLTAVVIMFTLGVWQLNRAEQKQQRLAHIATVSQQQGISPTQALSQPDWRDMPVIVDGQWLDPWFLIDNKLHRGQPGYYVVRLLDSTEGVIAVNLGWIAAPRQRDVLPTLPQADPLLPLTGVAWQVTDNPMIRETATVSAEPEWPVRLQQIDLAVMGKWAGLPLMPLVVLSDARDNSPYVREWQPVVMPPEKHIAYAIQWFGMALACMVVFVVAVRRKNRQ
ncbi:SURF1 family protein [Aestuariibacter halophilus]|uniref:SURF1-like protein n=1 Tax=Fluctibacter halophilus TaxID=226011 RepID=A0ABS8G8V4_9ALTE|nr:SURF1 family protein [Aestuariibacter halophilus]MCC2617007.1 SURF1 family protein [Aestuariibacter halophilus]